MPESDIVDIIIIGAGPAGLFCAIHCCKDRTCRVLVLEKMNAAGRKLLLSGSGSCNITHSGKIKDFEHRYGNNGRFLRHAFSGFSNIDMVNYLNSNGIHTIETENGKIFPGSMKAREILDLLMSKCTDPGVEILYGHAVQNVQCKGGKFRVRASDRIFESTYCVITTGGLSYPGTGSSGEGLTLAENLGHKVTDTTPALTPVTVITAADALTPGTKSLPDLSGITIKNTSATLYRNNRKVTAYTGDLLFTHTGLSGPVILDMSRYIQTGDTVAVSLIQGTYESFEEEFILNSRKEGKRAIRNLLHSAGIPERIVQMILDTSSIPHDKKSSEISREERKKLASLVTAFPFIVISKDDYNMAMATHGGVSLEEINMRTMESKIMPGLFFAGEVMDIDGDTGGYNLQAAFSTGKLAGDTIRSKI
ncbi:MAG TPA: NAD(P)/FAD-dependent oxidoreductase [Spirochaetota bacterium]|nr:NAD(P)/FAD-dependent oxidoreductase [Spirochaetota bacterium]